MMQDIPDPANRKPDTPVAFDRTVADEPAAFPISIADFEKTIRTIDPGIITPGIYERNSTLFEPQRTGSCRSETPPRVEEPSIGGKLGERQVLPEICSGKRYRFTDLIGAGGEGTVFSAYDDSFGREIAVKVLRDGDSRERLLRFLREARTMALLEHPNIVPVYDIELADDGEVFFTMRKIKGISLGEAIRAKSRGENIREIDAPEDIVSMFLKVCDALAFAHNRGVIHHDVKPDNIVLGPFGEVLLLDWGSSSLSGDTTGADAALSAAFPRLIGTPAYMSPEQARAELITERSDVYCLGATMFHTLTLRHPAWGTDVEQFWEKKRTGTIDPLKPGELQSVPHQLIAIVLKAIEPNPADRYGSIIELADDLKRFLTGRAIGWRLLFEEQFESGSSDALEHDWIVRIAKDWANPELAVSDSPGGAPWRAKDGSLTGACEQGFAAIASRKKIQGNMRIEWIAMSRAKNENLNCFIAGETRLDGYAFHVGGFGFANQVILTKGKNLRILDMAILDEELQALNPYTFRMEKEERSIRLFINNAPVIEYEDPDVLGGPGHQTFGFEVTGGNMVEIRDVRVFYQPLPLAVSPLAIADSYFENRLYDQALVQCREILTAYPDTNLAKSAGYKIASVKQKLGDTEGALGAFEQFEMDNPRHPLATPSMYERSRILRSVGRTEDADRVCRRLAEECPGQPVLRMVLYDITASLMETCPVEEMEKGASALRAWASALGQPLTNNLFLEKYASLLADKKRHAEILEKCSELRARCARVLLENLGRPDRVLTEYPDQRKYCALALNSLNRYRETLVKYPEQRGACANALYACNDLERVLSEYPEQRILCVRALGKLGRVDEIIAGYRDLKSTCASNLTYLGQIDKVASLYHDDPTYQVWILYASGQFEELLERYPGNAPWCAESLLVLDRPHEVIDKYRAVSMSCAKALLFLNRPREVLEKYPDMETQCIEALCMMGVADEALRRYPMNFTFRTNYFMNSGRAGEFLEQYWYDTSGCATALLALGNAGEVVSTYSVNSGHYVAALRETGQFQRILEDWSDKIDFRADSLLKMGRFDELGREITGRRRSERAQILIHAGKLDDVLSGYTNCRIDCARALIYQKRYDEVEKRYPDQRTMCRFADLYAGRAESMLDKHGSDPMLAMEMLLGRHLLTLEMYCASATEKAHAQWKELSSAPVNCMRAYLRFPCFLLVPFLRFLEGAHQEFRAAYEDIARHCRYHFAQELWHSALFIPGAMDEATFDAQPSRQFHESNAALCRAMRAEVNDDKAAAYHWYTLLCEMPPWIKPLNPVIETFTSWRKRELEKLHL